MRNDPNFLPGNKELLTMIKSKTFDRAVAARCAEEIPDFNQPILNLDGYSSTYLYEAQSYNNVEAVRFLLENGADPNFYDLSLICCSALSNLQYLYEEMEEEVDRRLEIARLFFEYGADPDLEIEYETIYDYIFYKVFNDVFPPVERKYLLSFFKLLIAYGGGSGNSRYPKPSFSEPIDKKRINEYTLEFYLCDDGYHIEAHMFNPEGVDIGTL